MNPLEGIRVLELTEALAGPYCAMLLADLGADVIKIERPSGGDQSRQWGARLPGGESAYFCSTNRGKRSIVLDILEPKGRAALESLLATADVLICNIPREESLLRAGLDFTGLHARFPRLIMASITGYGRTGPSANRSGYDLVAQGEAGLMSITGTAASAPLRFPIPVADMTTGLYTVIGILAALRARDATGQGQQIDLSLLESQAAYLTILAGDYFATGKQPGPVGNAHPSIVPYQVFQAADREIVIAVGSDKHWTQFCALLGLGPEIRDNARFSTNQARLQHRQEIVAICQQRIGEMPSDLLLAQLRAAEIPSGPINSVSDILQDPHYLARGKIVHLEHPVAGEIKTIANPIRLSATPPAYHRPPPMLGEHTEEVLTELGAQCR